MSRMLAWSTPGKTGGIYVVDDELRANIVQMGRKSDGTKRFRVEQALDGHCLDSAPQKELEWAMDDAEQAIYLRAKVLIPRLVKYVEDYEHYRRVEKAR